MFENSILTHNIEPVEIMRFFGFHTYHYLFWMMSGCASSIIELNKLVEWHTQSNAVMAFSSFFLNLFVTQKM